MPPVLLRWAHPQPVIAISQKKTAQKKLRNPFEREGSKLNIRAQRSFPVYARMTLIGFPTIFTKATKGASEVGEDL